VSARPTSVSPVVVDRVSELLSKGNGAVRVVDVRPAAAGWSPSRAEFGWLARLAVSGWAEGDSVVVKTQRPADHWRQTDTTVREHAALVFLAELSCNAGPRLLAADHALGIVVLEDLGSGPAVEDVLIGADRRAATEAVIAHARVLAEMQAATRGRAASFYRRVLDPKITSRQDRVCVQVMPFRRRWEGLRAEVVALPGLPSLDAAESDLGAICEWLDDPGPMLALSNGDFMPQNSRIDTGGVRLLDFEGASFQHLLLDAVQLRIPYAAAPCWGRLPRDVTRLAEDTYRSTLIPTCPAIGDDQLYGTGMATAAAAWAVVRMTRLTTVDRDGAQLQPFGWSDRGQLLDLLRTAIVAAADEDTLPRLRAWLEQTVAALERRWPGVPEQPHYPAFR
jgi:hypothetical protein